MKISSSQDVIGYPHRLATLGLVGLSWLIGSYCCVQCCELTKTVEDNLLHQLTTHSGTTTASNGRQTTYFPV